MSLADRRFLGNAKSVDVGNGIRRSGWRIACSRCFSHQFMINAGPRPLPPEIILKKLEQAGWTIANNPKDDLCRDCQKRIREERRAAVKAKSSNGKDHHVAAPEQHHEPEPAPALVVKVDRLGYDAILEASLKLSAEEKRALINSLRSGLPKPVRVPKDKPKPVLIENDPDYEQWLKQGETE